jgi:hypothetical protein
MAHFAVLLSPSQAIPSSYDVTFSSSQGVPSSHNVAPSSSQAVPSSHNVAPSLSQVVPSSCEVIHSPFQVVSSSYGTIPFSSQFALFAFQLAPSTISSHHISIAMAKNSLAQATHNALNTLTLTIQDVPAQIQNLLGYANPQCVGPTTAGAANGTNLIPSELQYILYIMISIILLTMVQIVIQILVIALSLALLLPRIFYFSWAPSDFCGQYRPPF